MKSRMDRYHNEEDTSLKRTLKNEKLYRTIYEESNYSNIENIETIENGSINIEQIKEMLKKDTQKKEHSAIEEYVKEDIEEERIYDINEIINNAIENEQFDNKKSSIDTSDYNYKRKNKEIKEEGLLGDTDDESDLFDDLKKTSDLNDTLNKEEFKEEMDKTFVTGSLHMDENDFEKDEIESKPHNVILIILIVILSLLFIALIIYLLFFFHSS